MEKENKNLSIFCCPVCHSDLDLTDLRLSCCECKKSFRLIDSVIPDFRPDKCQAESFNLEEIAKKQDNELNHSDVLAANIIFYNQIGDRYELIPEVLRSNKNRRVQHRTREALQRIASKYSLGSSVLDMGCGTGFVMDMARGIFDQIIGMDCSVNMVRIANNKGHRVCLGDVIQTPFNEATFDMIATSGVLHHLFDPLKMMRESFRILKKGGVFFADFEPNYLFQRKVKPGGPLFKLAQHLLYSYNILLRRSVPKMSKEQQKKKYINTIENICEYHHYKTKGLIEEEVRSGLNSIGFKEIEIIFHGNCESIYSPRIPMDEKIKALIAQMLGGDLSFLWDRSLKTNACHLAIIARKP